MPRHKVSGSIELNVNVLTMGHWPTYTPMEIQMPAEVRLPLFSNSPSHGYIVHSLTHTHTHTHTHTLTHTHTHTHTHSAVGAVSRGVQVVLPQQAQWPPSPMATLTGTLCTQGRLPSCTTSPQSPQRPHTPARMHAVSFYVHYAA